ncbi:MAG: hypothetical protein ACM3XS_05740, partial [Bacteroidota bacterium]
VGLGYEIALAGEPVFFELRLAKEANLLIRVGGDWFYKRPGVEWVDATGAATGLGRGESITVSLWAPPADGMNPGAGEGYAGEYIYALPVPPECRVRY